MPPDKLVVLKMGADSNFFGTLTIIQIV